MTLTPFGTWNRQPVADGFAGFAKPAIAKAIKGNPYLGTSRNSVHQKITITLAAL